MKKQAVILAAGSSTRTIPLTLTRPKPLLPIGGKTLIEHNLDALQGAGVEEVAIVVGYKKDQLITYLTKKNLPFKFYFVEQKEPLGTAHALLEVKKLKNIENFLLLMGDDLYFKEDLQGLSNHPLAILGFPVSNASRFGVLEAREDGSLKNILEKPPHIQEGIVNTGAYSFTREIFKHLEVSMSSRGEMELTDSLTFLSKETKCHVVSAKKWIPVTYAWSLLDVAKQILPSLIFKNSIEGRVESGTHLEGKIHLGKGSVISSGAYLKGPIWIGENCTIGSNAFIGPYTAMENNCNIGHGCSIHHTLLFESVEISPLSVLEYSVLGEQVKIGAGTLIQSSNRDQSFVTSKIQGKSVNTERRNLGIIVGDRAHLEIGSKAYPGSKIWPDMIAGETIKEDQVKN